MKLLLDTHIFLWYLSGDAKLTQIYRDAICDADNEVFLSVASIWESTIKYQLGKLPLPELPETYLPRMRQRHGIQSFIIDELVIAHLAALPALHRDPFDRIMIAQAQLYNLTFVTVDRIVRTYPVTFL